MTKHEAEELAARYQALGYETEIIAYNHTETETRYRVEYWVERSEQ